MSNINYQVLREKAEKATKGSYIVGHTSVNQHGNLTGVFVCQKWKGEPGGVIAECHVNCLVETDAQAYANAEFIAEANPATVLALLDEQERNQQYIKRRDQENEDIALTVGKLRVELEAAEKRIAELQARDVKPVAWMRNANVTSFMSRFTTDEKYAVEQWGDDAVALYPLPVAFIPACFTDERNLMHINERGRETSLIWSKQNSDSGDIKLFRIAAAAGKGEES
nr:ead/Ea22-like family protein [Escherichia coli]EIC4492792.1 ead/Ea22-like family protein [Escherichia coli]